MSAHHIFDTDAINGLMAAHGYWPCKPHQDELCFENPQGIFACVDMHRATVNLRASGGLVKVSSGDLRLDQPGLVKLFERQLIKLKELADAEWEKVDAESLDEALAEQSEKQ